MLGGTLGGGLRPASSAMRPGSGLHTSAGPIAGQGESLGRNVEVLSRPAVMREGMKGMSATAVPGTSHGPGRQVVDRSYCIGLLRPKIAELTAEIERLRAEEDQIHRNGTMLGQLQQKNKQLTDDIHNLKGNMSDVNFAVERANQQDAEAILAQAQALRTTNGDQRKEVDRLFLSVKEVDAQTKRVMSELEQSTAHLEARLTRDGADVGLYRAARDAAYASADAVLQQHHEIRALAARREALLAALSQDPDKRRAAGVLSEVLKKRAMRDAMAKECSLSVDEERQLLIRQAKTTAADIDVLQRQITESRDAIQDVKGRIDAVTEDMSEYSGENARKFQELQEKDREMQEFIDAYPEREREEAARVKQIEAEILDCLDRLSRIVAIRQQMPTEGAGSLMDAMSRDMLDAKDKLESDTKTQQRLEKELAERKVELEKVVSLDEKITQELSSIATRVREQQNDIVRYNDLEALRTDVDARKRSLQSRKAYLLHQRDNSKFQVQQLTLSFDQRRQQLNDDEVHGALSAAEQKLRLVWQGVFALEEFVRLKEKESQYQPLKADCMRIVEECNAILQNPKRFESPTAVSGL